MLSQLITHSLEHSLRQSVQQVFYSLGASSAEPVSIALEQPANPDFGDYSSNIAMQLAKVLRKAPMVIAELITNELVQQGLCGGLLQRAEVAAPGFVNMYIDWQEWADRSFELPPGSGEKVIIEHTSVNPNKSVHIR